MGGMQFLLSISKLGVELRVAERKNESHSTSLSVVIPMVELVDLFECCLEFSFDPFDILLQFDDSGCGISRRGAILLPLTIRRLHLKFE